MHLATAVMQVRGGAYELELISALSYCCCKIVLSCTRARLHAGRQSLYASAQAHTLCMQALLAQGQATKARLVAQQLLERSPQSAELLEAAAQATTASSPARALEAVQLARCALLLCCKA